MKVFIAADHAGYDLKTELQKALPNVEWQDLGPSSKDSVDYPDFADLVAKKLEAEPGARGLLICGSGQGMQMRANKYPHVRAALAWDQEIAQLSRQHNDANVLCLPARFVNAAQAAAFTRTFLETAFEGGRHSQRVAKVGRSVC